MTSDSLQVAFLKTASTAPTDDQRIHCSLCQGFWGPLGQQQDQQEENT